jgi:hypothetical protein
MIKLYDLVFEDIEKNDIDLGDKTQEFNEKLELMTSENQKILINFVKGLNDTEKKEFGSLLNKYPSVEKLEAPQTSLEKRVANEVRKQGIGPGEILFHLELQDSSMVGDTNHDLTVKGKVWEVKMVDGIAPNKIATSKPNKPKTKFMLAKKGRASKFKFNTDLLRTVILIDKIIENSQLEDDFNDISPRLRTALDLWEENVYKSEKKKDGDTPKEKILQGDHTVEFRNIMIKLINIIKSEIEVNTDNEFTNVRFGGVGIVPKEKGIDPVSIQKIDDDSVTLNFIGKDTLKAIEILNDLPYAQGADFENDFKTATFEALEDMPSMIVFSLIDGKLLVIEKEKFKEVFEFGGVTQGNLIIQVKHDVWRNA